MSFFSELKRRNVVRVAIAYLVFGWVLAQVGDLAADNLAFPGWFMPMLLVVLGLGFPLALILAWAYEMTPSGVKKTEEVDADASITHNTGRKLNTLIIAGLALALGYFMFDKFMTVSEVDIAPVEVAGAEKSIAVLPFVNMSEDSANEYFSDGLAEELLNVLVKLPDLKVAGRTSSFAFKGQNVDLRTIGQQLGVSHILEGSVRKQEDRVRITAQLIRSEDGFHLWSESYDRELADIFAVQEEIATAIAGALAIELEITDARPLIASRTSDMEAYDKYLEARMLLARRDNFDRIFELLDEATALDPDFAPAWGTLAQAYALVSYFHLENTSSMLPLVLEAAERALALDPELATAHSAKADAFRDQGRWLEAEESYLNALRIDPDNVEANSQYAQMLARAGYTAEALTIVERAVRLDPISWVNLLIQALLLHELGEYEQALETIERAQLLLPLENGIMVATRFNMRFEAGDLDGIMAEIERVRDLSRRGKDVADAAYYAELAEAFAAGREAVLEWIRINYRRSPNEGSILTGMTVVLGDLPLAEEIIQHVRLSDEALITTKDTLELWHGYYTPLRRTGVFKTIVESLHLPDYWRVRGFPPGCRPLEDNDFECG